MPIEQPPPPIEAEESTILAARDSVEKIPVVQRVLAKARDEWGIGANLVTTLRVPLTWASLVLHREVSEIAGTVAFSVQLMMDWADGAVARAKGTTESTTHGRTKQGGRWDPLVDKINHATALTYVVTINTERIAAGDIQSIQFATVAGVSMLLNYLKQRTRGPVIPQIMEGIRVTVHPCSATPVLPGEVSKDDAKLFGKIKQGLEFTGIATALAAPTEAGLMVASSFLAASIACNVWDMTKRLFLKKK